MFQNWASIRKCFWTCRSRLQQPTAGILSSTSKHYFWQWYDALKTVNFHRRILFFTLTSQVTTFYFIASSADNKSWPEICLFFYWRTGKFPQTEWVFDLGRASLKILDLACKYLGETKLKEGWPLLVFACWIWVMLIYEYISKTI
jgi:hypothetical protein